jgi:multidrug efflux pump subunit AcrA (membrane-fusion protein)
MKAVRYATLLFLPLLLGATLVAAEQLWTCGMHPQIIKKEPGNCPVCGMKLTPIRAAATQAKPSAGERKVKYYKSTMMPGEVKPAPGKDSMGMDMVPVYEDEDASAQSQIQIDAATIQRMNLRTAIVTRGAVKREIRTVGSVAYNEQGFRDITTKYEGWLEKLYVNTTWSVVKAGDPLFEIYSPDLYNAQLNYLLALRSEQEPGPLTRAALARLQLFDLPDDFIAELKRSGEAQRRVVFRAPADGVVVEKMGVAGQMMKPGERIYRLADLSSVWVLAQVYEKDLPYLHAGQEAAIRTSYGPERQFSGPVSLVLPQVEEQTRAAIARIVLANPDGFLRPGMFVEVTFSSELSADAVLVPDMAVLRSGERNTVFVALDGGFFEPREVRLGARSEGGLYEVLEGLKAGERVVTSGQFMLDSESQLREAIQKMLKPTNASPMAKPTASTTETPTPTSAAKPIADTLSSLAFASADAALALAKDDLAVYQAQLPALRDALAKHLASAPHSAHGPLGGIKDGLSDHSDIKTARKAFAAFSSAVTDAVRSDNVITIPGLWAFECSMAKARWLQRDAETKNPFYGEGMLTCGEVIAGPKPQASARAPALDAASLAAGLPPGHPPIGSSMSVRDFLLAEASTTSRGSGQKSDGACGSCGMSAEAMAAGEPCEHAKN